MAERRLRTDLAVVRAALDHAERSGVTAAAARAGVNPSTVCAWRTRSQAAGGTWPTDQDITEWRAAETRQAATSRAWTKRWQLRVRARGGPMTVDGTGTTRRLHALMAIGYRYVDIAERSGCKAAFLGAVAGGRRQKVHAHTAERVRRVYELLSGTPGPSQWTRTYARNRGWAPPLAWDDDTIDDPAAQPATVPADPKRSLEVDEVAIYRATHGDRVTLTTAERRAAVRLLTQRGRSEAQIAETLGVARRVVARDRAAA